MSCEFCKKVLSSKSNLNYHQKNNKTCLLIQQKINENEIEIALVDCEFCNQSFSKSNLVKHLQKCKTRPLVEIIRKEKDKEIEIIRKEKDKEIEKLKKKNSDLTIEVHTLKMENGISIEDHKEIIKIANQPKTNNNKRKLSESIKKEVAHRQNYICYKCEKMLPPTYQTDHIVPHSISYDDNIDNLQALCPNCHSLKTQRENIRIIKFKSLLSKCPNLCWFCLEEEEDEHMCSKILKDINIKKEDKPKINVSSFDEMIVSHIRDENYSIVNNFDNLKINNSQEEEEISNILFIEICLHSRTIIVNKKKKYKTIDNDILPSDVGESVFQATRSKKYSNKIDVIEIVIIDSVIEQNDEDKNKCCNYLSDILLDYIPNRILKKETEIFIIL